MTNEATFTHLASRVGIAQGRGDLYKALNDYENRHGALVATLDHVLVGKTEVVDLDLGGPTCHSPYSPE